MSNPYINVYKNNPTAGDTDGTAVSTDDAFTSPISVTLDASQNESKIFPLAVRTEAGYIASDVVISDNNDTNDRLKLGLTSLAGGFADSISIGAVDTLNTVFYAQATSSSLEAPQTDRSANFKVSCVIAAV